MKKLLDSDWLTAMQFFFCKQCWKELIQFNFNTHRILAFDWPLNNRVWQEQAKSNCHSQKLQNSPQ